MFKLLMAGIIGFALMGASFIGAGAADDARIRVIHASPDAPNVDVYANGASVLTDVPFEASSGYLAVPAGSYKFEIYPAGANAQATDAVLTIDANLEAGTDYTVLAIGRVAEIEAAVFEDNNAAPAAGKAHVGVVHAGPDAPAVDVAVKDGPVLVSNLAFSERQGPLPVDATTYNLEVRPTGSSTVALPLDGVSLEAGKVYTFVATGLLSGNPDLKVLAFAESPAPVHMSPPSAGDGGLLGSSQSSSSNLYLLGAALLVSALALGGLARRVAVRR